jgi:hypothetical protein
VATINYPTVQYYSNVLDLQQWGLITLVAIRFSWTNAWYTLYTVCSMDNAKLTTVLQQWSLITLVAI